MGNKTILSKKGTQIREFSFYTLCDFVKNLVKLSDTFFWVSHSPTKETQSLTNNLILLVFILFGNHADKLG
jgi:hypothetical protein